MPRKIDQKNFKIEVLESKMLSIVQFKSDWSGACQIIEPVYRELAKFYKTWANFFTTDIETSKYLEKEFGIVEVPTILFFKGGVVVDHVIGLVPKNSLKAKIESAIEHCNK